MVGVTISGMLKPRLLLITMFQSPAAGALGELALFIEAWELLPASQLSAQPLPSDLYANSSGDTLAIVAGVGTANTAVSLTALGLHPNIDLTDAFILICGIAGGNPNYTVLGDCVWADWCIDGDLAFEFDAREIPTTWPTGIVPLGAKEPYGPASDPEGLFGRPYQVYALNGPLLEKALVATSGRALKGISGAPAAGVKTGATLAAARFWHGQLMNVWAERWVQYWTKGCGHFHTSGMEDSGSLHALHYLSDIGKLKFERVAILRSVSNYSAPVDDRTAIENLFSDAHEVDYPGMRIALENAFSVADAFRTGVVFA